MKAIPTSKLLLLFILFLGIFSGEVQADTTYQNSWLEASLDPCTGRYTLRFVFGVDEDVGSNDEWDQGSTLEYKVGSGSWTAMAEFNNFCIDVFPNIYGCNNFTFDGTGFLYTEFQFAQSVSDDGNETTPNDDVLNWARVSFNAPPSFVGEDVQFRLDGTWEGETVNVSKPVDAPILEPVSSFSATDASLCSQVGLSWVVPDASDLCTDLSGELSKFEIYRQSEGESPVFIQQLFFTESSYFDFSAEPGIVYTYSIRHVIGNEAGGAYESTTSEDQGSIKTSPDAPVNVQASQDDCNGIVFLEWNFQSGLDSLEVYRDGQRVGQLLGNTANFTNDDEDLVRGVFYNYTIRSKNNCGWGELSDPVAGVSPADPEKSPDLTVSEVSGVGIQLDWIDVDLETGYRIERNLLGGGGATFIDVPADVTSYVDESILICQTYQYRIITVNDCKPEGIAADTVRQIILTPNLDNTFSENALNGSKGFFSNRVELTWSVQNNSNFLNGYKIYRRTLGSAQDSILITSVTSNTNLYIDNFTDAGVLYEYFVVGETQCENETIETNVARDVGFRSPFGTVTGNVSYTGDIAVKDVRISAVSSSQIDGRSLAMSGLDTLEVQPASTLQFEDALLFETWLRPANLNNDFTLANSEGVFDISYQSASQSFVFEVQHGDASVSNLTADASGLINENFVHLAFQYANDSLYYFLNGQRADSSEAGSTEILASLVNAVHIGAGFEGVIDETRIWNVGKTDEQITRDYSRIMVGGESGLRVYLKYNEGNGSWAYDISRIDNNYNTNDAQILGSLNWSETIPSGEQLSVVAYTDASGNYTLTVPYNGQGEGFVLTPGYLIHEFTPNTRTLFIGDGQFIYSNVDFEDISSFTVSGTVFYENTECPAGGVNLLVDGVLVITQSGLLAETEGDGTFEIQVPIGDHYVSVSKPGHVFPVGRFPDPELALTYDFQADRAGVNFVDGTLVKVIGRVVGGLREANKKPGLDLSKNNLGVARLAFVSTLGNGCAGDTVFTDTETGEYVTFLPPLKFTPSVGIVNDAGLSIDFGILEELDLSGGPQTFSAYDTTFTTDGLVDGIDSVSYNKVLDYIHRVNPIIIVKDRDGINDFIGDSLYTYINPNTGDTLVRNLRPNAINAEPFRWPVFTRQDDDYEYRALIKVFERYVNFDDPTLIDSVPSTDGVLTVNNGFADLETAQVELSKVNTPDSLNFLIYSFKAEKPNFLENNSIPEYSFTSIIEMNVETGSGEVIPWLPIPASEVPAGGIANFRAVYLGTKTDGEQFVSEGPKVPEYVLRDPPGSQSFAQRESGTERTTKMAWDWTLGSRAHMEDNIFLGAKFSLGLGVSTLTDNKINTTAGFSAQVSGGRRGTQSVVTTNTDTWSTNEVGGTPGSGSDRFIAQSRNIQFGIAETLAIVPDSLCDQVECLGVAQEGFEYAKRYSLAVVPGGYETTIIVSQDNIVNQQIPDLIELRNVMIQSNPKYTSNLPITDPNYGKNNDNPVFGSAASTDTPGEGQYADLDGPSYTYAAVNLQDTLTGDSIRFVNNQIRQWEEAIRLNEWEKVNISNQSVIDSLRQKELDELEDKYKTNNIIYTDLLALNAIGGSGFAFALVANPVPGSSFAGYAVFAVTSATGIALIEISGDREKYEDELARITEKYGEIGIPNTTTIGGGAPYTNSMTHATATAVTNTVEYQMTASMSFELANTVSNNGVGYEKGIELSFKSQRDWSDSTITAETVSYTLYDPEQTDLISVDVYPSLLGWGPIFKKRPGGQTSCPYEDEELTLYYEPGTVISAATQQVDKPSMTVSPSTLSNVPVTEFAVFNLTLGNASESDNDREYEVSLVSTSNPFGAIATIDGNSTTTVYIPAGSSVNKVLAIQKGPGAVYDYDSLLFVITVPCEDGFNLADSVYVSASFIPTCTDVALVSPEEAWVANNFNNDTISSIISGYDYNFFDFEELKVEYKPSNESEWIGLKTFYKDTTGLGNPDAALISNNQSFTLYDWEVNQLVDGYYDLRTRSVCTQADNTSVTYSGILDRINPHPFGTPSPADGILSPSDDIGITFNETVDLGSLTVMNFDVRGVLNGTETKHSTSLFFDGVDDYADVSGGVALKNRSFTLQLAVKRAGTGEETLLSQGIDTNENLFLGFNAANQLVFRINDQEVVSTTTFDNDLWHYIGLSYDFENETADMFLANQAESGTINVGNNSIFANVDGGGRLLMGKQGFGAANPFHGNIHEVRVWDRALTFDEFTLTMNRILSGSEAGLLYNWRMDEAEDVFAADHIRRRDAAIFGATWAVEPGGSAAQFDGASYLSVGSGDVLITPEMNFTLEFWFRGSGTNPEALFSNGSGGNTLADSLLSWVIEKDATGLLHARNNGVDFLMSNTNYFDGTWHHVALVMNRNANLSALVDGNPQLSTQAGPFEQLGGATVSLGAHVYQDGGLVVANQFTGELDGFRLWNTNRKVEQIDRDKRNRMLGNEPSLKLYMPFENYTLDPTGISILTPSFDEQIDSDAHVVVNNGATLGDETPTIKLQRPIDAVAFTYAVNNDEVIISVTSDPAMVENVTLDITVTGVRDLQGNVMASPVTWIAFMDKNQVVWADDLLVFEKPVGGELNFSSQIVNQGGAAKAFTVENIPEWMSVNPSSGTIPPNSTLAVSFDVDPLMNIGDYVQDVQLLTDFGFAEKLTIDLKVRETPPDWTVDPADFQYSMGIIGMLEIKGIVSSDAEDMLSAFVGNEVRGAGHVVYLEALDRYLVFMDIYSNTAGSEQLTFKIWDAGSGVVYSQVTPEFITFSTNELIGSALDPQVFSTNFEIEDRRRLDAGWNWVGYYLQNADSAQFDNLLSSLSSQNGDQVNGQDIFANYSSSSGWTGPLANSGLRPEAGYKFYVNAEDTLVIKGDVIDPTSRTISMVEGWNWIGFVSIRNQGITQALGNLNPMEGDQIKGRSAFAVYVNDALGWQGTLQTLLPGEGYMYKSGQVVDFTFPFAGLFKSGTASRNRIARHSMWQVDYAAFANNMNMFCSPGELCGSEETWNELLLGAFDDMGTIRGLADVKMEGDKPMIYMTVNAAAGSKLNLKWIDIESGMVYPEAVTYGFDSNGLIGSFEAPIVINLPPGLCDQNGNAGADGVYVYPTLFDEILNVAIDAVQEGKATITLFDMSGRALLQQMELLVEGQNQVFFDVTRIHLSAGTYTLVVETDTLKVARKVIKTN